MNYLNDELIKRNPHPCKEGIFFTCLLVECEFFFIFYKDMGDCGEYLMEDIFDIEFSF
jgi:hypothetical protein